MHNNSGFVDLRVGHGAQGIGDDSVWPSFTDIMMVIVMIFLMALVIMMVRNTALDLQLETTESEKQESTEARDALRVQLTATLKQRDYLAQQTLSLRASEANLNQKVVALTKQLAELEIRSSSKIESLTGTNLSLSEQLATLTEQLKQVQTLLRTQQQQAAQREQDTLATIEELEALIRQRKVENVALQKIVNASDSKFQSLQDEFTTLDAKYRHLVRPARSPVGKHVVEVRITESADGYLFYLTEPSQSVQGYTREKMHARLAKIKAKQGKKLYTKIVIPDDSQLTHSEAWKLTQEILEGYDYYYQ